MEGLAAICLCLLVAVALHEAGHAAAAQLLGFRITSIGIAGLRIRREGRFWRLAGPGLRKDRLGYVASRPQKPRSPAYHSGGCAKVC